MPSILNNHEWRKFIKIMLLLLLATFSIWLAQVSEPLIEVVDASPHHDKDYFAVKFTATVIDAAGKLHYQLQSDYLEHFPEDNITKLRNPSLVFFQNGMRSWLVSAHQGQVKAESESVRLSEQVRIYRPPELEPWTMETAELWLYTSQQYAETDYMVEIHRPRQIINALGMRADLRNKRVEFLRQFRGRYEPMIVTKN